MSNTTPEKYGADEWEHLRKRFFSSILNDIELAKLGQNVGISWPFKGSDETPMKYIEYDFEELWNVPGLIGKKKRVHVLMDIMRETLAFDDPFSDMVDSVESESREDDTFERILDRLNIRSDYPAEFVHFSPETIELLRNEDLKTLLDVIHFGQKLAKSVVVGGDIKSFLNSLAHKDELSIAKHIPYRRGERGLHLAEAMGLIAEDLDAPVQLELLRQSGGTLTEEEAQLSKSADGQKTQASLESALGQLDAVCNWFADEAAELEQVFSSGGAPERYFIPINDARRENVALGLARLKFSSPEEKRGLLGKISGLFGH